MQRLYYPKLRNRMNSLFNLFKTKPLATQGISIGGDNQGVVVNGSVKGNIIIGQDGTQHPLSQLHINWNRTPDPENIASMLKWDSRIPQQLIGRDAEMEEFLQWASSNFQLKFRILHAQGGMGKTRFAFELAEQLIQQGWNAGEMLQLDSRCTYRLGNGEQDNKGLLLIIDYPEEKGNAIKTLIEELAHLQLPEHARLRILLLSRRAELTGIPGKLEAKYDLPYELLPLNASADKTTSTQTDYAWQLFQSALHTMQSLQQASKPKADSILTEASFQHWLKTDPLHKLPLFILAFARHLLDHPEDTQLQGAAIIRALVQRETRRLREEAEAKGLNPNSVDGILLLKALAGITGGIDRATLEQLRRTENPEVTLPAFNSQLTESTLWDSETQSIPALQPDLLAAELLQSELNKDHLQAGKWLFQCITQASQASQISQTKNNSDKTQQQALERLIRLISDDQMVLKNQQTTPLITALVGYIEEIAILGLILKQTKPKKANIARH